MLGYRHLLGACLAVTVVCGAAASPPGSPRRFERPPPFAESEIRDAAHALALRHVRALDEATLVEAAARALDSVRVVPGAPAVRSPDLGAAIRAFRERGGSDLNAVDVAVAEMARSIGPTATWYPAREVERRRRTAVHAGVGLEAVEGKEYPIVVRIERGSAAAAAGLVPGVELRAVDGRSMSNVPLAEAYSRLDRDAGVVVQVTIGMNAEPPRTMTMELKRRVDGPGIDCRILDGRVLYIAAREPWQRATMRDVRAAVARIERDGAPSLLGLVLDLRGDGGGQIDAVRDLADELLAEGPLFGVAVRGERLERLVARRTGAKFEALPLVVLIDRGTGAGAELVAAAVQDNRRGRVLGARTQGDGRVDSVWETESGGQLLFAAGQLLRANGAPIEKLGITPDPMPAGVPLAFTDAACSGSSQSAAPSIAGDGLVGAALAVLRAP